jgi:acetyl-CoA carboxylase biotin carboxylase subunit
MFRKVLIANRGEIAVRIARACRELEIPTVAVYSEADRTAPHVRATDEAVCVGPPPSRESYLNIEAILEAARRVGADAVHPGYGFLSENAPFAHAVREAGLTFVGPPTAAVAAMGDKTAARKTVSAVGVPVAPALEDPPSGERELRVAATNLGYPLLLKAAAGGGGKGMRVVRSEGELAAAFAGAQREAESAFGDGRIFLERYIERPRHIEVQVLADAHGTVLHLGERECSVQRRHQKIVEEAPSPAVDESLRREMTAAAIAAAQSVGYVNAGTVEFLLAEDGRFYFLEMNTRLQVEHPITEWIYGVDLVHAQLRIATGERLWFGQEDVRARGHAIECRVYAEDPAQRFLPSPGRIHSLHEPAGAWVRVDSGVADCFDVPLHYDPMLAKISVWGADRETARRRMISGLSEYAALGITTSVEYLIDLLRHPRFAEGATHTHFIEENMTGWGSAATDVEIAAAAAALHLAVSPAQRRGGPSSTEPDSPWLRLGPWRLGAGTRS